jgi:REP element-mobilizing transposase RayT
MAVHGCLVLPFSPRELLDTVNEVLGRELDVKQRKGELFPSPGAIPLNTSSDVAALEFTPAIDVQVSPQPWIDDVNKAAQHLARLSLSSASQAALILRDKQLWAYAGQLPQEALEELAGVVLHYWERDNGVSLEDPDHSVSDLARFVRLKQTGLEYMLYATSLGMGMVLSLVYDSETPFHKIRTQANQLARALTSGSEIELNNRVYDDISGSSPEKESTVIAGEVAVRSQISIDQPDEQESLFRFNDIPPPTPSGYTGPVPVAGEMQWVWEVEPQMDENSLDDYDLPKQAGGASDGTVFQDMAPDAPGNMRIPDLATGHDRSEAGPSYPHKWLPEKAENHSSSHPTADDFNISNFGTKLFIDLDSAAWHRLSYACVLMPRLPSHLNTGDLSDQLEEWMRSISLAFGWRLEHLAIRPNYMHWIAGVTPRTSVSQLVRIVRQHTSQHIFDNFPRLARENPSGDYWAPGYLALTSMQPLPGKLVMDFIIKTRQQQGASGEIG